MLKKLISYLIIFSIFYSDAAWCGRYRSKSICNPEEVRRTPSLKKNTTRVRSQSLSDFKRSNAALINFDPSTLKIKKTIPLGRGIVPSDDLSPSDTSMDISENRSQNSMSIGTISSSNSSPREDDASNSPKSSPNSSPTKSLESSIDTDSLLESNSPSFETGLLEEKGPNVKPPLIHLLLDNKIQKEELKQGSGDKNTLSLPLEPTVIFPMDPLKKFEEKIGRSLPSTQGEEQQTENKIVVDLTQETVSSEKPPITIRKSEGNSSELPLNPVIPIPSLIVDSFSQENEQGSSSRKNSSDSKESTCNLPCLLATVILPFPNQQESKQNVDSFSSSPTKGLKELENTQSALPEQVPVNEDSKQERTSSEIIISLPETTVPLFPNSNQRKESEKKGTDGFSKKVPHKENLFEKIKRLNKADSGTEEKIEERKEILVSASHTIPESVQHNSKEVDAELGKSYVKKDKDIEKADVPNEKTRLFPKNKQPLNLSQQKSALKEDWQKVGSDSDSLQFRSEHGDHNFSDDDFTIGNPKKKADQRTQGLEDGWVDLGPQGNSVKAYELQPFHGDRGGKEPNPFSINGENDERILLEDEKEEKKSKPLPKLVPDYFKEIVNVPVEKKDPTNLIVSLERSDSEEDGALTLVPVPQSRFAQFLKDLPQEDQPKLKCFTKQLLNEECTIGEGVVFALGLGISGIAAVGELPVFNGGFVYFRDVYKIDLIDFPGSRVITGLYVPLSTFFDILPSITIPLQDAFIYFCEEGISGLNWRVISTGIKAFFPSLDKPLTLLLFELYAMNRTHNHGVNNQFSTAILLFSWFLFASDYIRYYKSILDAQNRYEQLFPPLLFSTDAFRNASIKKLEALTDYLYDAPQIFVDQLYEMIRNAKKIIKQDVPELEEVNLEIAQVFFTLRRLLILCEDIPLYEDTQVERQQGTQPLLENIEMQLHARSWWGIIEDTVTLPLILVTSTLAYQLIVDSASGYLFTPFCATIISWPIAAVAGIVQTVVQRLTTPNFSDHLVEIKDHESAKLRAFQKAGSFFQACMFNVARILLSVEVCDKFLPNIWWSIIFIPLILKKFTEAVVSIDDSYHKRFPMQFNHVVKQFKRGGNCFKKNENSPTDFDKRSFLWRFLQTERNRLKTLSSFTLEQLEGSLQVKEDGEDQSL